MMPNPGHCPVDARGRRINVELKNGKRFENWAADTTRRTKTGRPHDVALWEISR